MLAHANVYGCELLEIRNCDESVLRLYDSVTTNNFREKILKLQHEVMNYLVWQIKTVALI
jgi:hypothetical protein